MILLKNTKNDEPPSRPFISKAIYTEIIEIYYVKCRIRN